MAPALVAQQLPPALGLPPSSLPAAPEVECQAGLSQLALLCSDDFTDYGVR